MFVRNFKRLLRQGIDAVLPVNCAGCDQPLWGDPIPFFCQSCWTGIHPIQDPRCPRCSFPFPSSLALLHSPSHQCGNCRIRPPAFSQAWTLYPYQSPLKEAIGLFKYHGKISLAHPLANLMLKALNPLPPIDVICPVPLHPDRLKEREYNQSLLLADRVEPAPRHSSLSPMFEANPADHTANFVTAQSPAKKSSTFLCYHSTTSHCREKCALDR